ncbi:hypothetical protein X975_08779, partial [Stegodyphus mimosarum]
MAWPAYSPDLNPIENLWDALGRVVSSRFPPPATLIELEIALQEEWRLLNSAVVDHLIESMVTRCGFIAEFIVSPFFYENITPTGPETSSVTGGKYRHMLNSFVIPALQQRQCLREMIFMQDGAPPHVAVRVQQMLRQKFTTERVISRYFPTAWPPRSPDITPCDFWLWSYLKSKVYQGVVQDLATSKDNISRTVREIPADILLSTVVHTMHRMQYVVHKNGSHIEPHSNAK